MKTATKKLWPATLVMGLLAACGGGDRGYSSTQQGLTISGSQTPYRCTLPPEGQMQPLPGAVLGGQIEGRSHGSFVLVSHTVWGARHVVLMLGPDPATQSQTTGYIDAVPEQLFCLSDGGHYSNGVQFLGGDIAGSNIYLKLEIDPVQGSLGGTLRDYGNAGITQPVSGGPIPGGLFDPAAPPSIAAVQGDWTLVDWGGQAGSLAVAADGWMKLQLAQCSYSGTLAPANGLNLLNMQLRRDDNCQIDTDETQGFVLLLPLPNGQQQLMLWGVDNGWGFVTQAMGRR